MTDHRMTLDRQRRTEGLIALVLFALTIPAANWLIGNAGTVCVPNGPCLVPVWPGIKAPSGVVIDFGGGDEKWLATLGTRRLV